MTTTLEYLWTESQNKDGQKASRGQKILKEITKCGNLFGNGDICNKVEAKKRIKMGIVPFFFSEEGEPQERFAVQIFIRRALSLAQLMETSC